MDLLIKGMEMPSEGCKIISIRADGTVYVYGSYPTKLHKVIPVPTPHGRLIDADKMEDEYKKKYGVSICFGGVPTVIEAEEG